MTGAELTKRLEACCALDAARVIVARCSTTLDAVASRDRHHSVAQARHQIAAYLRVVKGLSTPEIGTLLDRDHTTVAVGVRKAIRRVRARSVAA